MEPKNGASGKYEDGFLNGDFPDEQRAFEDARLRGLRDGYTEGLHTALSKERAAAAEEAKKERAALEEELNKLSKQTKTAAKRLSDTLPERAMQASRTVLEREFHRGDKAFLHLFSRAAAHVARADQAVLHASPYGCAIAARHLDELKKQIDGLQSLELRPVEKADDGLCILETDAGSVDASLNTQFEKAMRVAGIAPESDGGEIHAASESA